MRKGEKGILVGIGLFALAGIGFKMWQGSVSKQDDRGIPFFSTASPELASRASVLYRKHDCRNCHTLWSIRDVMQAVPAPPLDGIGSLKTKEWLATYLAAPNPQDIVPSRLKPEYRMPSYAGLSPEDRSTLVEYLASLKVQPWYLDEVKKVEYEKLTGKEYAP